MSQREDRMIRRISFVCSFITLLPLVGCLEAEVQAKPSVAAASPLSACGTWVSMSSGNSYEFLCRGNSGGFNVLDSGLNLVGDGMQVGESVTASLMIPIANQVRPASLQLQFQGPNELVGFFVGYTAVERGNLRFVRR